MLYGKGVSIPLTKHLGKVRKLLARRTFAPCLHPLPQPLEFLVEPDFSMAFGVVFCLFPAKSPHSFVNRYFSGLPQTQVTIRYHTVRYHS